MSFGIAPPALAIVYSRSPMNIVTIVVNNVVRCVVLAHAVECHPSSKHSIVG